MKLKELLRDLPVESVRGPVDLDIAEVRDDSRAVGPGDLFVALAGGSVDGHAFVEAAAARGAAAVVVEREVPAASFRGTLIRVASARRALALIAARRFGEPGRSLRLVAVTGTNGKTTTCFLLESILRAAGCRPGVIGTVSYRYGGEVRPAPFTTPTPLPLHATLAEMRAAGCTHVILEASSHAMALDRLYGLEFRAAAFTNLTQDHLDFHGTMEEYFQAKALLFRRCLAQPDGVGVILLDGPFGPRMAKEVVGERVLVSVDGDGADVHPMSVSSSIDGLVAELASPMGPLRLRSPLIGRFNLQNIAVAAAVALALGLPAKAVQQGVAELAGVPGRLERVPGGDGFAVIVDYAHSHDALDNVLAALRPLTSGRLLCVFGCGGDRDRRKRPRMGRVVAQRADLAILTSDNPRTEDPQAIVDEILVGVREEGGPILALSELAAAERGHCVELDRRSAIRAAIFAARPGDVVLLAGKGHEDYQIVGTTKHPFDDRRVAAQALAERAAGPTVAAS